MRLSLVIAAPLVLAACGESPPLAPQVPGAAATAEYLRSGDWPSYNRDLAGTRFSPLREISPTNVDELRQAWSYPLGDAAQVDTAGSELTPLAVAGVIYAAAADRIVALHAHSGAELWRFPVADETLTRRGLAYWPGDDTAAARIYFTTGRRLVALDAATGKPAAGFGSRGEIEIGTTFAGAPTRFEQALIVGSSSAPGGVRAFDVRSGAALWSFETTPLMQAFALTIDIDRGLAYAAFSGPQGDAFYGGERTVEEPYENAIVALDARTGVVRWHFQTVHHDLWGYDLAAPPALLDVTVGSRRIAALAQAGKTGYLYFLDRVTGEPVFGVVETPVPPSDVPGERAASTQPVPVKPPPLARMGFKAEDIVTARDTTAEHAESCRALRERSGGFSNRGPFTPFGHRREGTAARSTIVFPGSLGGAGWGGVAVDPERGLVFVNVNDDGAIGWIERNADGVAAQAGEGPRGGPLPYRRTSAVGGPHARFWNGDAAADSAGNETSDHARAWPCQKPPWGTLAAVSATTGDIVWQVPLGVTEQLPEGRRRTGRFNLGGPIVTAAGLVFVGASNDRRFRAFDARTGAELWVTELPLSAHAVPITYLGADGKQYVAIVAAGGATIDERGAPDARSLIAYALP